MQQYIHDKKNPGKIVRNKWNNDLNCHRSSKSIPYYMYFPLYCYDGEKDLFLSE